MITILIISLSCYDKIYYPAIGLKPAFSPVGPFRFPPLFSCLPAALVEIDVGPVDYSNNRNNRRSAPGENAVEPIDCDTYLSNLRRASAENAVEPINYYSTNRNNCQSDPAENAAEPLDYSTNRNNRRCAPAEDAAEPVDFSTNRNNSQNTAEEIAAEPLNYSTNRDNRRNPLYEITRPYRYSEDTFPITRTPRSQEYPQVMPSQSILKALSTYLSIDNYLPINR